MVLDRGADDDQRRVLASVGSQADKAGDECEDTQQNLKHRHLF
jgi:hypothetical protein